MGHVARNRHCIDAQQLMPCFFNALQVLTASVWPSKPPNRARYNCSPLALTATVKGLAAPRTRPPLFFAFSRSSPANFSLGETPTWITQPEAAGADREPLVDAVVTPSTSSWPVPPTSSEGTYAGAGVGVATDESAFIASPWRLEGAA